MSINSNRCSFLPLYSEKYFKRLNAWNWTLYSIRRITVKFWSLFSYISSHQFSRRSITSYKTFKRFCSVGLPLIRSKFDVQSFVSKVRAQQVRLDCIGSAILECTIVKLTPLMALFLFLQPFMKPVSVTSTFSKSVFMFTNGTGRWQMYPSSPRCKTRTGYFLSRCNYAIDTVVKVLSINRWH